MKNLDPNEGRIPSRVPSHWYEAAVERANEAEQTMHDGLKVAGILVADALDFISRKVDHQFDCPRSRDDYKCTCGLSDLKFRLETYLEELPACPKCHGKGGTLPNGVQYCSCD